MFNGYAEYEDLEDLKNQIAFVVGIIPDRFLN